MVAILNLLRWKNLAMNIIIVFFLKYFLFEGILEVTGYTFYSSQFSFWQTLLLGVMLSLIGAGGYVINDIEDLETDRINKKGKVLIDQIMSLNWAHALYVIFSLGAIGIGYLLGKQVGVEQLTIIPVLACALLWLYAKYFKSSILVGNILISILVANTTVCYFCFETLSFLDAYGEALMVNNGSLYGTGPLMWLMYYCLILSLFAFMFNLIREIVKDIEDLEGDQQLEGQTLPMAIGTGPTLWISRILVILNFLLLYWLYYGQLHFEPFDHWLFHVYIHICLTLPGIILIRTLFKEDVDYHLASGLLKVILLFGILSTAVFHAVI